MPDTNKPIYTYHWVRANMQEIKEKKIVKHKVGTKKVTKTKGIFKKEVYEIDEPVFENREEWVPTGKLSDRYIDIDDFAKRITDACNNLHQDGYEVVKIVDVIEGKYNYEWQANGTRMDNHCSGGGYSYGYGYSITDGVVIIAKLRNAHIGGV